MVATSGAGGHFDGVALIYIGGATPSRSILIAGAVIIPSVIFCPATMKIFAPGLRSPMLPGTAGVGVGVLFQVCDFQNPST